MRANVNLSIAMFLLANTSLLAEEKVRDADYYPLKKGYEWTYVNTDNETKATNEVIEKITKVEPGENGLITLEAVHPERTLTEVLSVSKEGVFRHEAAGKKLNPGMQFLKFPVRDGDAWTAKFRVDGLEATNKSKYGKEKVKVPAGEYDAIVVLVKNEYVTAKTWYAPGVGKVKQTVKTGIQDTVLELKSFKRP